jgi:hypothetical protein
MTTRPGPPPTELPTAFRAELRALIHAQPTPELRSSTIYSIVRECYDAVRAIHGPAADTAERTSMGDVSTAALGHEDAMYQLAGLVVVIDDHIGSALTPTDQGGE